MLYRNHLEAGIEITFQNTEEVEAARAAFQEHAAQLIALGNGSLVSEYQKAAIFRWDGDQERRYRASSPKLLVDRLAYFCEVTEERVDELLAEHDNPDRLADSGRRYELGTRAFELIESIGLHATMDAEWDGMV